MCLNRPCLNEPGYDNEWAVPLYAAPLGMGRNGKVCEDPFLACLTMMPYAGWIVWCRNNVRDGAQSRRSGGGGRRAAACGRSRRSGPQAPRPRRGPRAAARVVAVVRITH